MTDQLAPAEPAVITPAPQDAAAPPQPTSPRRERRRERQQERRRDKRREGRPDERREKTPRDDAAPAQGPRHARADQAEVHGRGAAITGAVAGVLVAAGLFAAIATMPGPAPRPAAAPVVGHWTGAATVPAAKPAAKPAATGPVVHAGQGPLTTLTVTRLVKGTGPRIHTGETVLVQYVLVEYDTGRQLESTWTRGGPVPLVLGRGKLIKGWERGLPGQRVGSRVRLDVPASLAYGPAQGDLRFVIDILAAR
jgi:peptidylprolyl isomerase